MLTLVEEPVSVLVSVSQRNNDAREAKACKHGKDEREKYVNVPAMCVSLLPCDMFVIWNARMLA